MSRRVCFVELSVYKRIMPLVSGYLQAYAARDAEIRKSCRFHYANSCSTPEATETADLLATESDLYVFSCHVWNMGLVRRVLPALLAGRPQASRPAARSAALAGGGPRRADGAALGLLGVEPAAEAVFVSDHDRQQFPLMKVEDLDHNAGYCHGMILRVESIMPQWSCGSPAAIVAA